MAVVVDAGRVVPEDVTEALAHLPVAVGIIGADGTIRYVNRAAEHLYGWRAEDVVGRSALALGVAPSDAAAAAELLASLHLGETWRGRFALLRSDGRRLPAWMSVVSLPLPAGADCEPELLVVAIDADDLQRERTEDERAAQDQADEANVLLQGLLDAVPVGMAFFDRGLRYVRVNEAMAETNGLPAEAHIGRTVPELLRDLPTDVVEDLRAVFETGKPRAERLVVGETPAEPGVERHWLVSYFPISRDGEVRWVGAVALEVTERDRLLASERQARIAAEQSAERLARLQIVTGRLAEAADPAAVADVVVRYGGAGVGAGGGALCIVDGEHLRILQVEGMNEQSVARFEVVALDARLPATDAIRDRDVVLLSSLAERNARYPHLVDVPAANRAFAAVPMIVDGRAIGCIAFGWAEERAFDDAEAHFLLALGRQAAQALERTRLYDAERAARAAAEEASARMRFLAEASRVLASSLDSEETLAELAALTVPALGDVMLVHLVTDEGPRLVAAAHRDPALAEKLAAVAAVPPRDRPPQLIGVAMERGEPIVLDHIPDELLQRIAAGPDDLAVLRSLELQSGIVVPLRGRTGVLGALSIGADASSGRSFDASDLAFVEDLAGRAAVAIENSRSHQARTEVAQTLQRSLLPPHLPAIPGLDLAQRYQSVGDVDVGGDFFDVFPAGPARWGLVMGDVCGKGVAAASLTALARYTVRAGAIEGPPAAVLRLLNRAILDADSGERFCTIAHARLEPGEGSARVLLACGGHPLPLLVRADGRVVEVGVPGTAIGLFDDVDLVEVEVLLGAGDALVLFTDGYTEARSPEGAFDPDLLARALAAVAGGDAETLADAAEAAVLAYEGGHPRDDMALLVVRVKP
jgi:PAS domain S-box-containing protein